MKPPVFHRMFQYDRSLLPNRHLAALDQVTSLEEARTKTGATIGYPGWGLIYSILLCHLDRSREELIIETGTNWGSTSIVLAQALIDSGCAGSVATFELERDNVVRARENLTAAGVATSESPRKTGRSPLSGARNRVMARALCPGRVRPSKRERWPRRRSGLRL